MLSPQPSRPSNHDRKGFTLVEVMVVMVLMSMAVTLAVTKLDGLTVSGRLESSASQLAAWFELARLDARSTAAPRRVLYASGPDRLAIQRPVQRDGRWLWGADQVFELVGGVRVDRVLVEGVPYDAESRATAEVAVRIDGSGGFRSHAVILGVHDAWIVVDHSAWNRSRIVRVAKRPGAVTYELLSLELALNDSSAGIDTD